MLYFDFHNGDNRRDDFRKRKLLYLQSEKKESKKILAI